MCAFLTVVYKFSGTGEWWNKNVDDVETDGLLTGLGPVMSDAFTINGFTGEQPSCRGTRTHDHHALSCVMKFVSPRA